MCVYIYIYISRHMIVIAIISMIISVIVIINIINITIIIIIIITLLWRLLLSYYYHYYYYYYYYIPIQENLDRKGDSAYYHAHNRKFEAPKWWGTIVTSGGATCLRLPV